MNLPETPTRRPTRHDTKTHTKWLDEIYKTGKHLTKWEWDFVESLAKNIKENRTLSYLQEDVLEKIYAEKTKL